MPLSWFLVKYVIFHQNNFWDHFGPKFFMWSMEHWKYHGKLSFSFLFSKWYHTCKDRSEKTFTNVYSHISDVRHCTETFNISKFSHESQLFKGMRSFPIGIIRSEILRKPWGHSKFKITKNANKWNSTKDEKVKMIEFWNRKLYD